LKYLTQANYTPSNGCCGPFDVSATLKTTFEGTNYDIVGITGTVTQQGSPFAISGLIPAPSDPLGDMGFNNIVFATAGHAPYSFDTNGVGFYASTPSFYPETGSTKDPATNIYTDSLSAFNFGVLADRLVR
jgi:hypothetical protein